MAKKTTLTLTVEQAVEFFDTYCKMKPKHPDAVLLYRYNDDYLIVSGDAQRSMRILEIKPNIIDLPEYECFKYISFPHGELEFMLPKLVRSGCRVAICEQLEDPRSKNVTRGNS